MIAARFLGWAHPERKYARVHIHGLGNRLAQLSQSGWRVVINDGAVWTGDYQWKPVELLDPKKKMNKPGKDTLSIDSFLGRQLEVD